LSGLDVGVIIEGREFVVGNATHPALLHWRAAAVEQFLAGKADFIMASDNVLEFTSANWQKEVVESDKPVLVDFWAVWCGPCRALTPIIGRVAEQFAGKVKVGKLNIDEAQDLALRYRVSGVPVVMLFKGGPEPIERYTGVRPEGEYVKILNRHLEAGTPSPAATDK
jgi:thioredoxin 1